jgi:hypothetical protein
MLNGGGQYESEYVYLNSQRIGSSVALTVLASKVTILTMKIADQNSHMKIHAVRRVFRYSNPLEFSMLLPLYGAG